VEWAIHNTELNKQALKILNYCQLYLHVTTISELFDATGKHILPHMDNCHQPKWFNTLQYMPIQPRPSHHQIRKIWKPICDTWKAKITEQASTLGSWSRLGTQSYWEPHKAGNQIYHWIQGGYWILKPYLTNNIPLFLADTQTYWRPLLQSEAIHISTHRNTIQGITYRATQLTLATEPHIAIATPICITANPMAHQHHHQKHTRALNNNTAFNRYTSFLPEWEQQLLCHTTFSHSPEQISWKLQQATTTGILLHGITDHNYVIDTTSFAWILFTSDDDTLAECQGPCPGPAQRPRADAWGLLWSLTRFLHHIQIFNRVEQSILPQITIMNRNKRIIRLINESQQFASPFCNSTLTRDWDIIAQLSEAIKDLQPTILTWLPMKLFLQQCSTMQPKPAYDILQLLKDTKIQAKAYTTTHPIQNQHSPFLPASRCMTIFQDSTIHGNYSTAYREAATLPHLHGYLKNKNRWSDHTVHDIHWSWLQKAIRRHHHASNNQLTKLVYNQLATPDRQSKAGGQTWTVPTCPHCQQQEQETFKHLLRCDQPTAIKFRIKFPTTIQAVCNTQRLPAPLIEFIQSATDAWLHTNELILDPNADIALQRLAAKQAEIGWDLFMSGFLTKLLPDTKQKAIQVRRIFHQTFSRNLGHTN
jgi:hypothetical protein